MYQWHINDGFRLCSDGNAEANNVLVTESQHAALMTAQSNGQEIVSDDNGNPIARDRVIPIDEHWANLHTECDNRLAASNKYVMPDYPHADDTARQAWWGYRQALRDLPSNTTDPANPVWPIAPEGQSQ